MTVQNAMKDMMVHLETNHPKIFEEFMKKSGFVKKQGGGDLNGSD